MDGVARGNSKPKKFTANTIKALKPGNDRREVRDPECRGLYVLVQPTGAKSFAVRYRFDGKPVKLTLPRGITLAAARKAAADALHEVEQGRNPSTAKRKAKEAQRVAAANTFKAVARIVSGTREQEGRRRAAAQLGMAPHAVGAPCVSNAWRPADYHD
jgi:hypothetical protein